MKNPKPLGWIVRLGADVIVRFRYPPEPEPGKKPTPFTPAANERMLAAACIAILGKGPGYEWADDLNRSSAEYVAKALGGKVERATAHLPTPPADPEQVSASAPVPPTPPGDPQTSLFGAR